MAIVRELVTLVKFETDGIDKVNAQVNTLKSTIMGLGKLVGLYFAADKVIELVDDLAKAGKEINKLQGQIARLARPGDDVAAAQRELFEVAQRTGNEYTHILDTYREFANESQESKVTQDQLLGTVENLYKAFRVGKLDAGKQAEVLNSINLGFRRGAIGIRQWGAIADEAPDLVNAIIEGMGGLGKVSRQTLFEMAKNGKLTADVIINALGKNLTTLNKDFAKTPLTIARAFTIVWNRFAKLSSEIWKVQEVTSVVAHAIVTAFDQVFNVIDKVIKAFGGLSNTIQFIGAMAATAIGIKLVGSLKSGLWWAAKLGARFIMMSAALAILTFGIMDLVLWMSGKGSIIGDYLGQFDDVMKFVDEKIKASSFGSIYESAKTAFEYIKTQLAELGIGMDTLWWAIAAVGVAFLAWNFLKFTGLLWGLKSIVKGIALISGAIAEAIGGFEKLDKAKAGPASTPSGAPGGKGAPAATPTPANSNVPATKGSVPATPTPAPANIPGPNNPIWRGVGTALSMLGPMFSAVENYRRQQAGEAPLSKPLDDLMNTDFGKRMEAGWQSIRQTAQDAILKGLFNLEPGTAGPTGKENLQQPVITAPSRLPTFDDSGIDDATGLPRSLIPKVGPQSMVPTIGTSIAQQNNTPTVNQTNSFTVQIDPSFNISQEIQNGINSIFDGLGRQARNAMPLVEAPKA